MRSDARVLVVDDEDDVRQGICQRLGRRGLAIREAGDCLAALAELERGAVDVIIMDVGMPGLDGIACLARVKERWPAIEVIILTGHASIDMGLSGIKNGAFDYCLKPCDFNDLFEKIQLALRHVAD
ncbi:MAG: hypothetical protein BWK76_13150 [Desulfobulbaceae bacterium A2]|nr:MAG: hypothetical protein BWK76_13150 [Desulfobulbaceae bacterium A2]